MSNESKWSRAWLDRWSGKVADECNGDDELDLVIQDERGGKRILCDPVGSVETPIHGQRIDRIYRGMVQVRKGDNGTWQLGSKYISKGDLITTRDSIILYDVRERALSKKSNQMTFTKGTPLIVVGFEYMKNLNMFAIEFTCPDGVVRGLTFFDNEWFWKTFKTGKQ